MRPKPAGIVLVLMFLGVRMGMTAAAEEQGHIGIVTSAAAGTLSMNEDKGESRTFTIDDKLVITVNGKPGKLEDLQKGMRIRVITDKNGKAMTVSTLDARK